MVERRNMLTGAALGAAGLGLSALAEPAAAKLGGTIKVSDQVNFPGVEGKMLINKPRAYAVMEQNKIDGLIALNPINVYYLTNTMPTMTKFRSDYGGIATFPRDPSQPGFLIASTAQAWDIVNGDRETPELITFTGAANYQDFVGASPDAHTPERPAPCPPMRCCTVSNSPRP